MSHPAAPKSLEALAAFKFEKIINEDAVTHTLTLLGTFPNATPAGDPVKAVIKIEKTALDPENTARLFGENGLVRRAELVESTDIYTWLFGWLGEQRERDVKINIVCPATDVHIRKYTKQEQLMVRETPQLYESIVKPYIARFPPSRTQWVENILQGLSEQSKVLYSSPNIMILPDMKWDLTTLSSLYLMALVRDRTIRSMRDLRKEHLPLLYEIRNEAEVVVKHRWGIESGGLRMYVHYLPSYYHFHVHIVNVNQAGMMGMAVGQAHLLDDIISLLEVEHNHGPATFTQMTLTYGLGDQHDLFEAMRAAQV